MFYSGHNYLALAVVDSPDTMSFASKPAAMFGSCENREKNSRKEA